MEDSHSVFMASVPAADSLVGKRMSWTVKPVMVRSAGSRTRKSAPSLVCASLIRVRAARCPHRVSCCSSLFSSSCLFLLFLKAAAMDRRTLRPELGQARAHASFSPPQPNEARYVPAILKMIELT